MYEIQSDITYEELIQSTSSSTSLYEKWVVSDITYEELILIKSCKFAATNDRTSDITYEELIQTADWRITFRWFVSDITYEELIQTIYFH